MTYSASAAQAGRGSTLKIATTLVGEIRTANLAGGKWDTADVTNFESGSVREFIATILDNGTIDIEGNRVSADAGQALVETAYGSGAISAFTLTLPLITGQTVPDTYAFNALVVSRDFDVDVTKEINWKVSLKISGVMTFTAGHA